MPERASELIFVVVIAVMWIARRVLRRKRAQSAEQTLARPETPVERDPWHVPDEPATQPDSTPRTPDPPARNREGTVAPDSQRPSEPERPKRLAIQLTPESMREAVILSEVLGKPKALR